MEAQLPEGTSVRLRRHDLKCLVGALIGSGGQGQVYRLHVRSGQSQQELALKWYHPHWATRAQFDALVQLADTDPPNRRFLWPFDVAMAFDRPGFGYVMPIRPARYLPSAEIMGGTHGIGFRQVLLAAIQFADSFLALHARGLCYRDISFGNTLIDPATGDVLVVDNDNVGVEGQSSTGIRGTPSFIAPEVIRGEALPGVASDLYSLAVLLFYLLVMHHPLEGSRLTRMQVFGQREMLEVYGWSPLFIFDPQDRSNSPDPRHDTNALVYWPLYPNILRDLFVQAFTAGLHDPGDRVRESQWREGLAQVLDLMTICRCGADVFLQPDGQLVEPCWSCSAADVEAVRAPRLLLDPDGERRIVILYPGKQLQAHHIGGTRFDYQFALARVEACPELPQTLGLRNLSSVTWTARQAGGECAQVPPRRTIRIRPGTQVDFGPLRGIFTSGYETARVGSRRDRSEELPT
jgi:DNA-binding helix-hairpin-helix protein with protein kinase domain